MTTPQDHPASSPTADPPAAGGAIAIPADLSPADAGALRAGLLAALDAAHGNGRHLDVTVTGAEAVTGGDPALPCARQLLAALERSAAATGVSLHFDDAAEAARLPLDPPADNAATE